LVPAVPQPLFAMPTDVCPIVAWEVFTGLYSGQAGVSFGESLRFDDPAWMSQFQCSAGYSSARELSGVYITVKIDVCAEVQLARISYLGIKRVDFAKGQAAQDLPAIGGAASGPASGGPVTASAQSYTYTDLGVTLVSIHGNLIVTARVEDMFNHGNNIPADSVPRLTRLTAALLTTMPHAIPNAVPSTAASTAANAVSGAVRVWRPWRWPSTATATATATLTGPRHIVTDCVSKENPGGRKEFPACLGGLGGFTRAWPVSWPVGSASPIAAIGPATPRRCSRRTATASSGNSQRAAARQQQGRQVHENSPHLLGAASGGSGGSGVGNHGGVFRRCLVAGRALSCAGGARILAAGHRGQPSMSLWQAVP